MKDVNFIDNISFYETCRPNSQYSIFIREMLFFFPKMIILPPMATYFSLYYNLGLSDSLDEDGEIFNPLTVSYAKELCLLLYWYHS